VTDHVLQSSLGQLETRLVAAALRQPRRLHLGNGIAGVLTMTARMAQLLPSQGRTQRAQCLVSAIIDAIGTCSLQPGLWSGLAGILYAMEYVRSVNPDLLGDNLLPVTEFAEEMDELFVRFARQVSEDRNFDLIDGICGIGAYALMRSDKAAAQRIFASSEQALLKLAERNGGMCAWHTGASRVRAGGVEQQRPGGYDLGVAHGTPGVIGLLSHAIRLGLATAHTQQTLAECLRWMHAQENKCLTHSRFPSFVEDEGPSGKPQWSRLAWCYGDLGVAAVVAVAAHAGGEGDTGRWWRELAQHRIDQPPATYLIADSGLCHGSAGALHVIRALQSHGFKSESGQRLAGELEASLIESLPTLGEIEDYGLIEGWSGALLALAESRFAAGPMLRPWNLCLLTPA
jgi:hypothetical protein